MPTPAWSPGVERVSSDRFTLTWPGGGDCVVAGRGEAFDPPGSQAVWEIHSPWMKTTLVMAGPCLLMERRYITVSGRYVKNRGTGQKLFPARSLQ